MEYIYKIFMSVDRQGPGSHEMTSKAFKLIHFLKQEIETFEKFHNFYGYVFLF